MRAAPVAVPIHPAQECSMCTQSFVHAHLVIRMGAKDSSGVAALLLRALEGLLSNLAVAWRGVLGLGKGDVYNWLGLLTWSGCHPASCQQTQLRNTVAATGCLIRCTAAMKA